MFARYKFDNSISDVIFLLVLSCVCIEQTIGCSKYVPDSGSARFVGLYVSRVRARERGENDRRKS